MRLTGWNWNKITIDIGFIRLVLMTGLKPVTGKYEKIALGRVIPIGRRV